MGLLPIAASPQEQHDVALHRLPAEGISGKTAASIKVFKDRAASLEVFTELAENEIYQVTIAADVPDNTRPMKVYHKKEPGHVFIILEQKDTTTGISKALVWGFYPVRPVSSLIFRNVPCELSDNSNREYNASATLRLTKEALLLLKQKAVELATKKYNLNTYNCYDYAVQLFNTVSTDDPLPISRVKFPFVFGRGGSPCCLYQYLQQQAGRPASKKYSIRLGIFKAPESILFKGCVKTAAQ